MKNDQLFYVKIKMKRSHKRYENNREIVRFPYDREEHLELIEKYLKVQPQKNVKIKN